MIFDISFSLVDVMPFNSISPELNLQDLVENHPFIEKSIQFPGFFAVYDPSLFEVRFNVIIAGFMFSN